MDWNELKGKIIRSVGKYRYVLLIVMVGLALMAIPGQEDAEQIQISDSEEETIDQEKKLEEILEQIQGVGRVRVMLTEAEGSVTAYQSDTDTASGGSVRSETVIVSGSNREESGLIKSVTPPTYLGAIVVCQGGDNASVRYMLVQAVSSVTGLSADRITVLKMK